eukprot:jgi/Botrbrau1/10025/Bobra.0012s0112.1
MKNHIWMWHLYWQRKTPNVYPPPPPPPPTQKKLPHCFPIHFGTASPLPRHPNLGVRQHSAFKVLNINALVGGAPEVNDAYYDYNGAIAHKGAIQVTLP